MDSIPVHMRITSLAVTNDDVDSRRAAVSELAATWGKIKEPGQIFAKVTDIAESLTGDGTPSATLGDEVQGAIQNHASAFLYSERPLDVGVCAGMAAITILGNEPGNNGWTISDVYSCALWSALSFFPPLQDEKRENLRREVLDAAREYTAKGANKARERLPVPDLAELTAAVGEDGKTVTTNLKRVLGGTIEALRRNAALDREELDFLWWAQLGRSRLLNLPFADIPEATRLVSSGIEGAAYLRRLPSDVHRDVVLRSVDMDPELSLTELLDVLGDARAVLGRQFMDDDVSAFPRIFPLLNALSAGSVSGAEALVKRKASDWGGRALLEAGLLRMRKSGVIKL